MWMVYGILGPFHKGINCSIVGGGPAGLTVAICNRPLPASKDRVAPADSASAVGKCSIGARLRFAGLLDAALDYGDGPNVLTCGDVRVELERLACSPNIPGKVALPRRSPVRQNPGGRGRRNSAHRAAQLGTLTRPLR
jgi:hypothetical protein